MSCSDVNSSEVKGLHRREVDSCRERVKYVYYVIMRVGRAMGT